MALVLPLLDDGIKKVAYGENSYRARYKGCTYGIHAEMASVEHIYRSKVTRNKYNKGKIVLNLHVIRINASGNYCESKPCPKCFQLLTTTKIKIKNITYSIKGGLVTMRFNDFVKQNS